MKILHRSERCEVTEHSLFFDAIGVEGSGLSFPCNAAGEVDVASLPPVAQESYADGMKGSGTVYGYEGEEIARTYGKPYVRTWTRRFTRPAVGECSCGNRIELHGFTNTCGGCGADYNWSGQLLAPRSQWGEETGETAGEILMGGDAW